MKTMPVIILGAGGHAKVLLDALLLTSIPVKGITDTAPEKTGSLILGVTVIGDDDLVFRYAPDFYWLVNGVGSVGSPERRKTVYEKFKKHGYTFAGVLHPSAVVAADVSLGEGVQVMAGAIIQTGSCVGENTIVNTGVRIDHDCVIGAHVHLAPGVTLSGGVRVGENVHIGTAAAVVQGVAIGESAVIAAGAIVTNDIPPGAMAMGVPARVVQK